MVFQHFHDVASHIQDVTSVHEDQIARRRSLKSLNQEQFPEHIINEQVVDQDMLGPDETTEEKKDPFMVHADKDDPNHPRNFPKWKKWAITVFTGILCFTVAVGSSMPTGALPAAAKGLNVSSEAINLSITLFVAGFGFGPMFFAPLSEIFGRYPIYVVSGFLYFIFTLPSAVADNIATMLAARMIAGLAASVPMTNMGGTISDIWAPEEKGLPMAVFSSTLFIGPTSGPLIGGAIDSGTDEDSWRYVYWTLFAYTGLVWIATLFMPETNEDTLLARRAKKLRNQTGDNRYYTHAERHRASLATMAMVCLLRPFELLVVEPILISFSLYLCLIYTLLYLMFFAYPIVFEEGHNFNSLQTGLCFLSIMVGILIAFFFYWFVLEPFGNKRIEKRGYRTPEDRLPAMFIGAFMLPASLFILAWTSMPSVHWAGSLVAGIPLGFCFVLIYMSANAYLVDCYPKVSASALAAKTLLRSECGAAVPLFVNQMFHTMKNQWAFTLLAFVSVAMMPIPFFFYFYGPSFRNRSKYAAGDDEM